MNEIIQLVDRVNVITTEILIRYHCGQEPTEDQDEFIKELFLAKEENYLDSVDDFPIVKNEYIQLILKIKKRGL